MTLNVDVSVNKLIAGVIGGGGTVYLTAQDIMPIEASIAIISSMMAFFAGEQVAKNNKGKKDK